MYLVSNSSWILTLHTVQTLKYFIKITMTTDFNKKIKSNIDYFSSKCQASWQFVTSALQSPFQGAAFWIVENNLQQAKNREFMSPTIIVYFNQRTFQ